MNPRIKHYHIGYGIWVFKSQVVTLLKIALKGSISAGQEKQLNDTQEHFISAIECLRFCFTQHTALTLNYLYFPDKKKSCKLVPIQLLDGASDRLIKRIHQRIKRVSTKTELNNADLRELWSLLDESLIDRILIPIGKRLKQTKNRQEAATLKVLNEYFIRLMIELSTYFHLLPKWAN
jgi:hypothetical protein